MFKKFLAIALCAMLALTTCAVVSAEEAVELRCQFWFDSSDLSGWQSIIDKFQEENPGITVVLESTTWNDYWTKLQTQATSDSVADVFGMVSMYSADYMANGVAMPLMQFADADEDFIGMENYYQAILSAYEMDGDYYFLPYDMSTMLILVNKDILAECGIEFKPEGWAMDEFMEICKVLKEKGYFTYKPSATDWAYYDTLTRAGCEIIDENGYLNLTGEDVIEVTQWIADMAKEGYAPYNSDPTDYFSSGMMAMTRVNPEGVANQVKNMDANLDVIAVYPTDVADRKVVAEGGSWGIYSKTKHPEEAWKLLKALTDANCSINMVAGDFRGVPTVNAEEATVAFLNSEFAVEHANYFIEMLSGSTRVDYPNRTAVESEMKSYLELIYAGDMTAAEGLAEFQEVADEIMGK